MKGWLVLKLDSLGNISWQKCFDFNENPNYSFVVVQNYDGSYIISGTAQNVESSYLAVMKMDSLGQIDLS